MKQIHKTIKSFFKKYDLEKSDLVYLVAFSGGFDSMCLLHALKKTCKNKIIAIHLNHKWRGEESDLEEQNCKNFCENLKVEFYSENLAQDVAKTETAAREARYKFFEKCAEKLCIDIQKGVYMACTGPSYETPAEIRMFRIWGASAVGMSTVPEVIVANHCGIRVMGISCITNMAAGVLDQKLTEEEVLETGARVGAEFQALMTRIVEKL